MEDNKMSKVKTNITLKSDIENKAKENIQHVSTLNTLKKTKAETIVNNSTVQGKASIKTPNNTIKSKPIVNSVNEIKRASISYASSNVKGASNLSKAKVSSNLKLKSDVEKKVKENIQHVSTLNTLKKTKAETIVNNSTVQSKASIKTPNNTIKSKPIVNSVNDIKRVSTNYANSNVKGASTIRTAKVSSNLKLKSDVVKKAKENIQHVSTLNTLKKTKAETIVNNSTVQGKASIKTTNNTIKSNAIVNSSNIKNISTKQLNVVNVKTTIKRVNDINKSDSVKNTNKNRYQNKISTNLILKSDEKKKAKESVQRVSTLNTLKKTKAETLLNKYSKYDSFSNNKKVSSLNNMLKNTINNQANNDDNSSSISVGIKAGEVTSKVYRYSNEGTNLLIKKGKDIYDGANKTISVGYARSKSIANKTKYVLLEANQKLKMVRGLTNGTFKIQVNRSTLSKLKNKSIQGIKKNSILIGKTLKTRSKLGLKNSYKVSRKSLLSVTKGIKYSIVKAGDFLGNQDDFGSQAIGNGIKYGHLTIKGLKSSPKIIKGSAKGIKTSVNASVKTIKGTRKLIMNTRQLGIKRMLAWQRKNTVKIFKKASASIVSKVGQVLGVGLKKMSIPIIAIIILVIALTTLLQNAAVGSYNVLFGSSITNKTTGLDIDERQWLTQKISVSRRDLVSNVRLIYNNNLSSSGGRYHFIRLFNSISNQQIDLTDTNILATIYSDSQYLEYMQPIFHVVMLSKYDLEPTEAQMESTFDEIWDSLTMISTRELPTEFCNGGIVESDGHIHSDIANCPNHSDKVIHDDNENGTLSDCDYWYYECLGHKDSLNCNKVEHKHDSSCYDGTGKLKCTKEEHEHKEWTSKDDAGCYKTKFDSSGHMSQPCSNSKKHLGCNGYYICNGHKVLGIYLTIGSFNDLSKKYFTDRINALESKSNKTVDEEMELEELKSSYEITMEYRQAYSEQYGGDNISGSVVSLDGVELTQITEFACQYIGNPYVYGGNDINNGIDCSAYVKYVYEKFGVSLPRVASDQSMQGSLVPSLAEAKPGDLIFYSEDGTDRGVYHVAMYIGDGKIVHASNELPYPQGGIKVSSVYGSPYKIKRIVQ